MPRSPWFLLAAVLVLLALALVLAPVAWADGAASAGITSDDAMLGGSLLTNAAVIIGWVASAIRSREANAKREKEAAAAAATTTPSALAAQAEEIAQLKQEREELQGRVRELEEERKGRVAELRVGKRDLEKLLQPLLTGLNDLRTSPGVERLAAVMAESNELQRQSIELQRQERRGA